MIIVCFDNHEYVDTNDSKMKKIKNENRLIQS